MVEEQSIQKMVLENNFHIQENKIGLLPFALQSTQNELKIWNC